MFEDTYVLELSKPISLGDKSYEQLELREPTAGEIEKASTASTNTGIAINLIQLIAKVPRKVAEQIGQRDFQKANDFFAHFSSDGEATDGPTSLPS